MSNGWVPDLQQKWDYLMEQSMELLLFFGPDGTVIEGNKQAKMELGGIRYLCPLGSRFLSGTGIRTVLGRMCRMGRGKPDTGDCDPEKFCREAEMVYL